MRKLVVFGLVIAAATLCATVLASAQHRGFAPAPQYRPTPQFHPAPVPQYHPAPTPQYHPNPGMHPGGIYNHAGPGAFGRHGLPMVQGLHGWHETHNRSGLRVIPGRLLSDGEYGEAVDFDTFVDSIDITSPIIPVDICTVNCGLYAALYSSAEGAFGWSWGSSSLNAAETTALNYCRQRASSVCSAHMWTNGTNWLAGVHCDNGTVQGTQIQMGSDAETAVINVFRAAWQQGFAPDSCTVGALITPDGTQQQFAQGE